jgi:imidazole glycerol-phosphate synthase subunit HisF
MNKKRLIGVITVKNGIAVQSINFSSYLPLGKPWCLAENMDRQGIDEILLLSVDRSINNFGPDYDLLESMSKAKLSVPLIYGGGISTKEQAIKVINMGADRIVLDSILHDNPIGVYPISKALGSQAIIASLPVTFKSNKLFHYDYRIKKNKIISKDLNKLISDLVISEILLIDRIGNGDSFKGFNIEILSQISFPINTILFGGINKKILIPKLLAYSNVSAISIGNSLSFSENSIQKIKEAHSDFFRPVKYMNQ